MTPKERAKALADRLKTDVIVTEVRTVIEDALRELLEHVGSPDRCRGCNAPIWWVRHHKSGNVAPYSQEHCINHFIDCPKSAEFKGKIRHEDE